MTLFIYLAVLDLCCCVGVLCSCGEWGYSLVGVR